MFSSSVLEELHKGDANRFMQPAWMRTSRFGSIVGSIEGECCTHQRYDTLRGMGDANQTDDILRSRVKTVELQAHYFLKKVIKKP